MAPQKKGKKLNRLTEKEMEYKKIQDEITAYAEKFDFHTILPEMIFEAYNSNSSDPYKCMAEFLINKMGLTLKEYTKKKWMEEKEEKDDIIRKLSDKVELLEKKVDDLMKLNNLNTNSKLMVTSPSEMNSQQSNAFACIPTNNLIENDLYKKPPPIKLKFKIPKPSTSGTSNAKMLPETSAKANTTKQNNKKIHEHLSVELQNEILNMLNEDIQMPDINDQETKDACRQVEEINSLIEMMEGENIDNALSSQCLSIPTLSSQTLSCLQETFGCFEEEKPNDPQEIQKPRQKKSICDKFDDDFEPDYELGDE